MAIYMKTQKVRLHYQKNPSLRRQDNLLRRHLTTEQRMLLFAELSRLYEVGRGSASKDQPRSKGKFEPKEAKSASIGKESVLEKTAREGLTICPYKYLIIHLCCKRHKVSLSESVYVGGSIKSFYKVICQ